VKNGLERVGDLEIDVDPLTSRRNWRLQRAGWVVMAALIAAALAGLFGAGALASRRAAGAGLEVEYERFARWQRPSEVRMRVAAPVAGNSLRLWIGQEYLAGASLERVTPRAASTVLEGERLVFEFDAEPGARAVEVVFRFEPRRPGTLRLAAGVAGGPSLAVQQFVYP
jgi:hypothetical protein